MGGLWLLTDVYRCLSQLFIENRPSQTISLWLFNIAKIAHWWFSQLETSIEIMDFPWRSITRGVTRQVFRDIDANGPTSWLKAKVGRPRNKETNTWRKIWTPGEMANVHGIKNCDWTIPQNTGWWCNNHFEKYEFVNGKDDIPYMKWKIKNVWNHQPVYEYLYEQLYLGYTSCLIMNISMKRNWIHGQC